MIIATGATSQSIDICMVDDDGLPVTGLVAATIGTIKYSRAGANADATISLSDLATITTAWASGGLKERGEGVYRLDMPDAAFSSDGRVKVRAEATGKRLICPVITVQAAALTAATTRAALGMAAADLDTQLDAIFEMAEADREIDTSTTPWEEVLKIRGTATEILRRKLRDTTGASVTTAAQVIGSAKEA